MPSETSRNPTIIPKDEKPVRRACPKCDSTDFNGRKVQGALIFTCSKCKCQWGGGLPQEPVDPHVPRPPESPIPAPVTFRKDKNNQLVEDRRAVSLTQEFRKGAPVPPPGEEDV